MIDQLTGRGIAVVLISHKFDEVMRADRVTVLRQGRVVATVPRGSATREDLAAMMVGRPVAFAAPRAPRRLDGEARLEVDRLVSAGPVAQRAAEGLSFTVRRGEILGIAGVAGNGQDALFEALSGCVPALSGGIRLDGEGLDGLPPPAIARRGVGYVPSDRYRDGLVAGFSIADNLIFGRQHEPGIARLGLLDRPRIRAFARDCVRRFAIVPEAIDTPAGRLSGGNAQKLILARELRQATRLLLCHQPTRGLDVGVIEYVHAQILAKRDEGCAVVLASEELDELLALADRILVLSRGLIMGIVEAAEADRQGLGLMMAGQRRA
jgi:simple sugar transport system ATP-binding protein